MFHEPSGVVNAQRPHPPRDPLPPGPIPDHVAEFHRLSGTHPIRLDPAASQPATSPPMGSATP